jgi:hypothetical protein
MAACFSVRFFQYGMDRMSLQGAMLVEHFETTNSSTVSSMLIIGKEREGVRNTNSARSFCKNVNISNNLAHLKKRRLLLEETAPNPQRAGSWSST